MQLPIVKMSPNRVRRNYLGGAVLDQLRGVQNAQDGDKPEEWLCSTVEAKNPGLPLVKNEGLSQFMYEGATYELKEVLERYPDYYLGTNTAGMLSFLCKWLDSSIRLHIQAHPTREFSRKYLECDFGKFEAYYVLAIRESVKNPYIRLGFQRKDLSKDQWTDIVLRQDQAMMDSCFENIPVQVGDVIYIPGGMPHAIGEGILLLELMEPSDLVVRCEFNRNGIIVPEIARFMGRDVQMCMDMFDYHYASVEEIHKKYFVQPKVIDENDGYLKELLLGSPISGCFDFYRLRFSSERVLNLDNRYAVVVCTNGKGVIECGLSYEVTILDSFFVASCTQNLTITPIQGELELCLILPPKHEKISHKNGSIINSVGFSLPQGS